MRNLRIFSSITILALIVYALKTTAAFHIPESQDDPLTPVPSYLLGDLPIFCAKLDSIRSSERIIDWTYTFNPIQNEKEPTKILLSGYIENKDSIYNLVEEIISTYISSEVYSYKVWESKTRELFGIENSEHQNDYDYLEQEINILDYLNWHLLHHISNYYEEALMHEIKLDISLSEKLQISQCRFIREYFSMQNTQYDEYGLCIENKSILNDNLLDLYTILTKGMSAFKQRKITQIEVYPYECENIGNDIIEREYQRFYSECIPTYDEEPRSSIEIERLTVMLADEHKEWDRFITHRNKVENFLTGNLKKIWAYGTKVWKLNRIRQLKTEFECYGAMSESVYELSLQDCNYTELMNYSSFSNECNLKNI